MDFTDKNKEIQEFIEGELQFIAQKASTTLNARMNPAFFSVDSENNEITLKFPVLDWEINGLGTLHGGMIGTMLDFTMSLGIQCFMDNRVILPTASLTVNYIRPVPAEGGVLIVCRMTSVGKSLGTAYCEAVVPSTGKVAATAIGTYSVPKPRV